MEGYEEPQPGYTDNHQILQRVLEGTQQTLDLIDTVTGALESFQSAAATMGKIAVSGRSDILAYHIAVYMFCSEL